MFVELPVLEAVSGTSGAPNLWGALGCSVAYAGALFTSLDAMGDYVQFRSSVPVLGLGHRLKYSAKLWGAGITVVSAGSVLALDDNWFAFTLLSVAFVIIVAASVIAARIAVHRQSAAPVRTPVQAPPGADRLPGTGSVIGH